MGSALQKLAAVLMLISISNYPTNPRFFHLNLTHALTLTCCFYVQQSSSESNKAVSS